MRFLVTFPPQYEYVRPFTKTACNRLCLYQNNLTTQPFNLIILGTIDDNDIITFDGSNVRAPLAEYDDQPISIYKIAELIKPKE